MRLDHFLITSFLIAIHTVSDYGGFSRAINLRPTSDDLAIQDFHLYFYAKSLMGNGL